MANPFKEKLRRDEVVVVLNPDHPSPSLTEFVATLGFDGVFIDCEHGMAGIERVQEMCRAARVVGVQSVVRPESDAPYLITRYLDAGAGGVMVPHIETPEAARSVVEAVRYARPKDYADKVIIAMLESVAAIDRLDDIVSVEGVDVFFIGPERSFTVDETRGSNSPSGGEGDDQERRGAHPRGGQGARHAGCSRQRGGICGGGLPISL